MKFEINQNILMEHLNYVIKGVSSKNIIPILNCIKLELTNEGLYLTSTDNEIAIKSFISSDNIEKIEKQGELVVSGKFLFEIVRKLPNTLITIEEVVDNKVFITTKNSSFNLNCNIASEFPSVDLQENKNPILINKQVFKNLIRQTSFATSMQESRPILTGINFKINEDLLEVTATDSYRLARKKINLKQKSENDINIIIPTKNILELVKLLNDDDENLEMHIFNNKIIFKFDTIVMMSRLINGTYPDTSKLIPENFELSMKVNLDEFYECIDRASLLTNEADKNTIRFESSSDIVTISSNIPEIGYVEEKIYVNKNNDNEIKIAFSSKYMLDALKTFENDEIKILFNGEIKPIIIKNVEDESLIQLILPIRVY